MRVAAALLIAVWVAVRVRARRNAERATVWAAETDDLTETP